MDSWLKILTGNVEKVDGWPRCTKKAIFFILKGFELDLCGIQEEEQERTLAGRKRKR